MKLLMDYHVHTALCGHAQGMPVEYAASAVEQGLESMGFTDHLPACGLYQPLHAMAIDQMEVYIDAVEAARKKYPALRILCGVEADIYPGFEAHLAAMRQRFHFDYVIGSVHYVFGQFLFDPQPLSWRDAEKTEHIEAYFQLLLMGIRSGLIDVVGHVDGIKWLFPDCYKQIEMHMDGLLQEVKKQQIILELNTSGRRKKPASPYPELSVLKRAAAHGIALIPGSDAHQPAQVAMHFNLAAELMCDAGYTSLSRHNTGLDTFLPM